MKKTIFLATVFVFIALSLTAFSVQDVQDLFQKALAKERAEGNLDEAIALYQKIAEDSADKALAAKAQLRIGICFEKMGKSEAIKAYERVLNNYADQAEPVAVARSRLAALRAEQPSRLSISTLPRPETGYLEVKRFSPDGTKMFGIDYSLGLNISYYDFVTKRMKQITNNGWSKPYIIADRPVVSPDGKQVAYIQGAIYGSGLADLQVVELHVADMSGKSRLLYRNEHGFIGPGDWLPDGSAIVAILKQKDESFALGLIPTKGGSFKALHSLDIAPERLSRTNLDVSPDGRFIVFDGVVNGVSKLHFMRSDGRSLEILADHPAGDSSPRWSPDGKHVVFMSLRTGSKALWGLAVKEGKPEGQPFLIQSGMQGANLLNWTSQGLVLSKTTIMKDVFVMPTNPENGEPSGAPRQLSYAPTGRNAFPVWSPDGKHLAFINARSYQFKEASVVVFPVDGGKAREYPIPGRIKGLGDLFDLRWFPDGSGIGFSGLDGDTKKQALFQLKLKTGEWKELPLSSLENWTRTEWKRDGSGYFYAKHGFSKDEPGIVEVNLASGEEKYIYRPEKGQGGSFRNLRFSRKHNLMAFREGGRRLIVLDVETGKKRTIFSKPHIGIAWSPDDQYVLTFSEKTLLLIPSMGGAPKKIDFDTLPLYKRSIRSLDWSPDGKTITFFVRYDQGEIQSMKNIIPENRR